MTKQRLHEIRANELLSSHALSVSRGVQAWIVLHCKYARNECKRWNAGRCLPKSGPIWAKPGQGRPKLGPNLPDMIELGPIWPEFDPKRPSRLGIHQIGVDVARGRRIYSATQPACSGPQPNRKKQYASWATCDGEAFSLPTWRKGGLRSLALLSHEEEQKTRCQRQMDLRRAGRTRRITDRQKIFRTPVSLSAAGAWP